MCEGSLVLGRAMAATFRVRSWGRGKHTEALFRVTCYTLGNARRLVTVPRKDIQKS